MLTLGQNGNNDVTAQLLQQQQQPPVGTTGDNASSSGLKFILKYEGNQSAVPDPSASPGGAESAKQLTINVTLQQGPGSPPKTLPITATVPQNTNPEDLQLCASIGSGQEQCQPLSGGVAGGQGTTIDLTGAQQGAGATTTPPPATQQPPPASPMPQSSNLGSGTVSNAVFTTTNPSLIASDTGFSMNEFYVPISGSLIGIEDTTLFIPVTVIAPINVQVQNAQICASLLSGGDQSCTQLVLNPQQTSFIPIDVDLTSPTPTFTSASEPTTTTTPSPTTDLGDTLSGLTSPLTGEEPTTTPTEPTAPTTTPTEPTAPTTTPTEPTAPTTTQGSNQTTAQEPTTTEPDQPTITEEPTTQEPDQSTTEEPSGQ
jgi:hypothetical protein